MLHSLKNKKRLISYAVLILTLIILFLTKDYMSKLKNLYIGQFIPSLAAVSLINLAALYVLLFWKKYKTPFVLIVLHTFIFLVCIINLYRINKVSMGIWDYLVNWL